MGSDDEETSSWSICRIDAGAPLTLSRKKLRIECRLTAIYHPIARKPKAAKLLSPRNDLTNGIPTARS